MTHYLVDNYPRMQSGAFVAYMHHMDCGGVAEEYQTAH